MATDATAPSTGRGYAERRGAGRGDRGRSDTPAAVAASDTPAASRPAGRSSYAERRAPARDDAVDRVRSDARPTSRENRGQRGDGGGSRRGGQGDRRGTPR